MKKLYLLTATLLILSVCLHAEEIKKPDAAAPVMDVEVITENVQAVIPPLSPATEILVSQTSATDDWTIDSALQTLKSKDHVLRKKAEDYLASQGDIVVEKLRPYLTSKDVGERVGALGVASGLGKKSQPLLKEMEEALVDPIEGVSSNGVGALSQLDGVSEKSIAIMCDGIFSNYTPLINNSAGAIYTHGRWSLKISKRLLVLLGRGDKEYLQNVVCAWIGHLDECEQAQTKMKKLLVSGDSSLRVGIIAAFMVSGIADDEICKETGRLFLEGSEINQKWLIEQVKAGIKKNPKFEASLENQVASSPGVKKIFETIHAE